MRWDPRVSGHRARALDYGELLLWLKRAGLAAEDRVPPPGMAEARPGPCKSLELPPYQEAALHAWNASGRRGVVVLPTGSGKTRLALSAMAARVLNEGIDVPDGEVGIVVAGARVEDMLDAVDAISGCVKDMSFELFCQDRKTVDAVVRNLDVIGEAARALPEQVRQQYPDIPWNKRSSA